MNYLNNVKNDLKDLRDNCICEGNTKLLTHYTCNWNIKCNGFGTLF